MVALKLAGRWQAGFILSRAGGNEKLEVDSD
jgi:hypothetical protein